MSKLDNKSSKILSYDIIDEFPIGGVPSTLKGEIYRRLIKFLFSENAYNDWFNKYGTQAVNHFGRLTEAKHLTEHNAWTKDYDYNWREGTTSNWRFVNKVTKEQRPLTEEQYNDRNYDLNERTQ